MFPALSERFSIFGRLIPGDLTGSQLDPTSKLCCTRPAPLRQSSDIFLFLRSGVPKRRCLEGTISCPRRRRGHTRSLKELSFEQVSCNVNIVHVKSFEQNLNKKHGTNWVKRLCWQSSKARCLRDPPIRVVCINKTLPKAQFLAAQNPVETIQNPKLRSFWHKSSNEFLQAKPYETQSYCVCWFMFDHQKHQKVMIKLPPQEPTRALNPPPV